MLAKLDYRVGTSPKVTMPPFVKKKRCNLKFVGIPMGAFIFIVAPHNISKQQNV
jgi:hypothetical protein